MKINKNISHIGLPKFTLLIGFMLTFLTACQQNATEITAQQAKTKTLDKPNIVLILSDDQSYTTMPNLGNQEIIAPNLAELAEQGMTFSHAYNMGGWNGAVCLASRAMFNSGRALWQARELETKKHQTEREQTTWAQLMQARGYETYMTGKWHVHVDAKKAFQHTKDVRAGMPKDGWDFSAMVGNFSDLAEGEYASYAEFMPVGYNRPLSKADHSWSPSDPKFGGYFEGGQHWSEVLKDNAIEFIQQASQKDKPFFMYIAFNAPHDPRQAPQAYQDLYHIEDMQLPANFAPDYPYRDLIGSGPNLRDAALAPFPRTQYAIQTHKKEYYALISHMDTQIGEILDALEQAKLMDNTYIIFTSDHGLAVGEHGLLGKQNLYDSSIRAPFIIKGPDIAKGKINNTDIYIQDAMATALDLAGEEIPGHVFFNSVLPLAKNEQSQSNYPEVYAAYVNYQRMIKKDGFKLLVYPDAKVVRLFDLHSDPLEINDLANQDNFKAKTKSMFKALMKLQTEMGDPLDLSAMYHAL